MEPQKAHSRILDTLQNDPKGTCSRRGSLAQTKILENAILETLPLGSGSRRGSLADIIPDWPTLKPFRLTPEPKVIAERNNERCSSC